MAEQERNGTLFQNCKKIGLSGFVWFVVGFLGSLFASGLLFFKGTIFTFLSCLSTQQPDNLTCNVPLEGKGKIWLSLQTGKSNHRLVATVKVWHRIKSIFWMVHHAQLAACKGKKKNPGKLCPEQTVPMPWSESATGVGNEPQILFCGLKLCAKDTLKVKTLSQDWRPWHSVCLKQNKTKQ